MTQYPYKTPEEAEAAEIANAKVQGLVEFEGHNCEEMTDNDCAGWDGEDRRCECGNRRVYWEIMGSPEIGYQAIAMAN